MKKLFAMLALSAMFVLGTAPATATSTSDVEFEAVQTSDELLAYNQTPGAIALAPQTGGSSAGATEEPEAEVESLNAQVKTYFIEGGPIFMAMVLICLILGLALCIERIIYLNLSTTNTKKLLGRVEDALNTGGVDAAKEVCRNTSGPVASIFYQGLDRSDNGIEEVEKSIESYGGVQMGLLERGLSWISLFIAIAPMLGFLGTVIGMIEAFDDIQKAGTMSATIVAGGIKVALITTVSGLIVAIILQIFYNYILSKIDGIILDMEDASITMVDMLYKKKMTNG